jgi:hypothetical protein
MTSRPISLQLGVSFLHLIARHHSIVILKKIKIEKHPAKCKHNPNFHVVQMKNEFINFFHLFTLPKKKLKILFFHRYTSSMHFGSQDIEPKPKI